MTLLSIQILLINFIVAGIVTFLAFTIKKSVRNFNLFLIYTISSIGAFVGTLIAMFIPNINLINDMVLIKTIILTIPTVTLSSLSITILVKGSRSKSYI